MDNNYAMLWQKQLSNNANNAYAYAFINKILMFILIYVNFMNEIE